MKNPKIVLSASLSAASVALSATANPYLDADGHINVARVQALNAVVATAFKKASAAAVKPIKPLQTFMISRKSKVAKYSAAASKKTDLKYQAQRAIKVGIVKRITENSVIRNVPLLSVYEASVVGAPLAAKVKSATAAITSHLKRADKTKASVGKERTKIRDASNKSFDSAVSAISAILTAGGLKTSDMVIGTSMFGKTMLVKLGTEVVSIGKSDLAKFRVAVKASKEAASQA